MIRLVRGLDQHLPIVVTEHNSYDAARIVASTRGLLGRGTQRKIDTALSVFEAHIAPDSLMHTLDVPRSVVVTPLMFESMLLERARLHRQHIVLPEGDDERILRAAATLLSRQVVDVTLLGVESQVRAQAAALGLDVDPASIVDPRSSDLVEPFAAEYARLRAHKGMTLERARDIVRDVSYFGTMMVHTDRADGMVSGAAHSTAHTITPAFEIIRTAPGHRRACRRCSSCASPTVCSCMAIVRSSPTRPSSNWPTSPSRQPPPQLSSGSNHAWRCCRTPPASRAPAPTSTRCRAATELVRARCPDLPVDGPIQYDAAVDASVGKAKLPGSDVAGRATVFIFPDLNTGNNTYKAVQRSAGAVAIGPVLQGLDKPVNDLSRGATVRDIVNTVAITAIQAHAVKSERSTTDGTPRS